MSQDWKPVVFHKKKKPKTQAQAMRSGDKISSVKKYGAGKNNQGSRPVASFKKLEGDEAPKLKKYDIEFRRRLQQARQEKKFTQKELAQKVKVKPTVIGECESGKGIWDDRLVSRMERALGTSLRKTKSTTQSEKK